MNRWIVGIEDFQSKRFYRVGLQNNSSWHSPYIMSLCISSFSKFGVLAVHCNFFPCSRGHGAVTPKWLVGSRFASSWTCYLQGWAGCTGSCLDTSLSQLPGLLRAKGAWEPPALCCVISHLGFYQLRCQASMQAAASSGSSSVTVALKLCYCDSSVTVTLFSCGTMNWCLGSQDRSTCRWTNPQSE